MAVFDKDKWLSLASSVEELDQVEALNMAKTSPELLQNELLYWFACNVNFAERSELYQLLDEEYQKQALELIGDQGKFTTFDRAETLDLFLRAEDIEMQRAIVQLERWFMKPTDIKNPLVLEYKNQKSCDLGKANTEVNRLFMKEPGQAADEEIGGGRVSDDVDFYK